MTELTTILTLNGIQYPAFYPNVGQKILIEQRKLSLSEGTYKALVASDTVQGNELLDFIDAFAYLSVCSPEIKLDVKDFKSCNVVIEKNLTNLFKKQFFPWLLEVDKKIMDSLTENTEEVASKDKQAQEINAEQP